MRLPVKARDFALIVLGTTFMAIVYGILHDLVTAHVCVEYFTIYHPHLVDSTSPVVMALLWGVVATWWFGAGAGAVMAASAVSGALPPVRVATVLALIGRVMIVAFVLAMLALAVGWVAAPFLPLELVVPSDAGNLDHQTRFFAVAAAHNVSYAANFVGAIYVCLRLRWVRRLKGRSMLDSSAPAQTDT